MRVIEKSVNDKEIKIYLTARPLLCTVVYL
jgi:hypothetical protein